MAPRAAGRRSALAEDERRTTAATLAWACVVSVLAAVIFALLSPVEDTGVVMIIPVVLACLLLDVRVALLTAAIAVLGDLANLRYGTTEIEHVVENTLACVAAFPVGRFVGARLGIQHVLVPDPQSRQRLIERLSTREAEVISFVLEGRTARDIGRELSVTDRTVETYTAIAYAKLGVHDRASLARLFAEEGTPPNTEPR